MIPKYVSLLFILLTCSICAKSQCITIEIPAKDLEQAKRLVKAEPTNPRRYNERGNFYKDAGQFRLALQDYTTAISFDPQKAFLYSNRSIAYSKLGILDSAILDIDKAIALQEENPDFYHNKIYFLYGIINEQNEDTIIPRLVKTHNKLVEKKPDYSSYYKRADFYCETKEYVKATADIERVLTFDTTYIDGYLLASRIYILNGDQKSALKAANIGITLLKSQNKIKGKHIPFWQIRGDILSAKEKNNEAINDYKTILSIDSTHIISHQNIAAIIVENSLEDQYQDALIHINKAIELKNSTLFYLIRGSLFIKLSQYNKAKTDLFYCKKNLEPGRLLEICEDRIKELPTI